MFASNLSLRFTNFSKLVKLNALLFAVLLIATTVSVSFGSTDSSTPDPDCGAQVALVLDRSASIGVDAISGGAAQSASNIAATKAGASAFVDAIIGVDSYVDIYAFASVSQRQSTGGWFNVKDQAAADAKKAVINNIKFKQGATVSAENAYDDGLLPASEGLTNWEDALEQVRVNRNDPVPSHLVIFTDGNPTTNIDYTQQAIAAGGNYTAAGLPGQTGIDQIDIDQALAKANQIRQAGTQIVPIAVGATEAINTQLLQALAGAGNPVYASNNFGDLEQLFRDAAADICKETSNVFVNAVDEQGNLLEIPANVTTENTLNGPTGDGETKNTSTNAQSPWSAQWSFDTRNDWKAQVTATQTPAGYEAVSVTCKLNNFQNGQVIPQVDGSANSDTQAILNPLKSGDDVYCQFVFKKLTNPEPEIKLDKTGPSVSRVGEQVTYTFTVTNTGNTALTNITITDETLSEYVDGGVTIDVPGTLQPGETSDPITYDFTIPEDFEGDEFVNVAEVIGTSINPNTGAEEGTVTDEDDHTIVLIDWEVTKTADKEVVIPGETVTYTITVTNTGGAALTNLEVSDPAINWPESGEPEVIDVLLPGESESFVVEYVIPVDYEGDTFTNVALVCLPLEGQDDECREPEVTIDVVRPSIAVVKTANTETANEGDTVTYTFVVTNTSEITISEIEVIDNVLGDLGTIDSLEPGESREITADYVVPVGSAAVGSITNVVTACFATPEWEDNCASDDHLLTIVAVGGEQVTRPVVGSLPFTGSTTSLLATLAGALLGAGAALAMVAKKKTLI